MRTVSPCPSSLRRTPRARADGTHRDAACWPLAGKSRRPRAYRLAAAARWSRMRRVFRLLRPRQWTKNALLFAALVFAEKLFVPEALLRATLAFVSFCLAASAGYVVNDVVDVERDRE